MRGLLPSVSVLQSFLDVGEDIVDGAFVALDGDELSLLRVDLPFAGTEPRAFIIVCATGPESKMLHVDVGIAAQSMLLKAVELGYNGLIIGAFNSKMIEEAFALPYPPVMILAIGKGNEHIELKEISANESHAYYRDENGTHYVPKVRWKELIIGC